MARTAGANDVRQTLQASSRQRIYALQAYSLLHKERLFTLLLLLMCVVGSSRQLRKWFPLIGFPHPITHDPPVLCVLIVWQRRCTS